MKNLLLSFTLLTGAINLSAQAGVLDASFANNGKLSISVTPLRNEAKSMVVQPDGKILAAGRAIIGVNYDFALVRFDVNGAMDGTFGLGGKVTTAIGSADDEAYAMALQPDGKIILVGRSFNGTEFDVALVRYLANGLLDTSFNFTGIVKTSTGPGNDEAFAVTIQTDGKIVVAGHSGNGADTDFMLLRLEANGNIDTNYGTNGVVHTDFSGFEDSAYAMSQQPDGKIVVAGQSFNGTDEDYALARYLTDGSLDTSFHNDGRQTTDFTEGANIYQDYGQALAIQPDGKIVVVGYAKKATSQTVITLARYAPNGDLDVNFGIAGKITAYVYSTIEKAQAVVVQPDGKLVVACTAFSSFYKNDFALIRFDGIGKPDASFGYNGKVTTDFQVSADHAMAVAMQPDGKILAAGDAFSNFAIARYLSGLNVGALDLPNPDPALSVYPNPVTQGAAILTYSLEKTDEISIALYDQQGQWIQTLLPTVRQEVGTYQIPIKFPIERSSGIYTAVLSSGSRKTGIRIVR